MIQKFFPAFVKNGACPERSEWGGRGKLFVLISCILPMQINASCDLTSTFSALVALSSTINTDFANTFTVINALGACNATPLVVQPDGSTPAITASGYYCLTGDTTATITISSSITDVTLDLNNHTVAPTTGNGVLVSSDCSRITIKNGTIVGASNGINLAGSSIHVYDVHIDGASTGISAGGITNLDIARVIVTNSVGRGFDIESSSNVTISACQASGSSSASDGAFYISAVGVAGSSVLVNSCIAADNGETGFRIYGPNVTLTNCTARGNQEGFIISSGTNITLANCIANFNINYGFFNNAEGVVSFVSCIAQNNQAIGFYVAPGAGNGGSGIIMSCIAGGNGNFGFYDDSSTIHYQYVANTAQGNGSDAGVYPDSNYYLQSGGGTHPNGTSAPYYQSLPNTTGGDDFVPTFWNNITLQ